MVYVAWSVGFLIISVGLFVVWHCKAGIRFLEKIRDLYGDKKMTANDCRPLLPGVRAWDARQRKIFFMFFNRFSISIENHLQSVIDFKEHDEFFERLRVMHSNPEVSAEDFRKLLPSCEDVERRYWSHFDKEYQRTPLLQRFIAAAIREKEFLANLPVEGIPVN